jgi:hypothetical protein
MMKPANFPPVENDQPLSDAAIREYLDTSQMSLKRWRAKRGMPQPAFRIGQTPYTWKSELLAWLATLGTEHRLDGKPVRRPRDSEGKAA